MLSLVTSRQRFTVLCVLALLSGFLLAKSTVPASADASSTDNLIQTGTTNKPIIKDHGSWKSAVTPNGSTGANVFVAYDHTSIKGLQDFATMNVGLAQSLSVAGTQRLEALVTFNRPLSVAEFQQLVTEHGLIVSAYTMRMRTPSGERWTISGGPIDNVLVPQAKLNNAEQFVLQNRPEATFEGFVDAEVSLSTSEYNSLASGSGVFLVDVTRTLARQEAMQLLPGVSSDHIVVDSSHPYWFMEDLGLQNFR